MHGMSHFTPRASDIPVRTALVYRYNNIIARKQLCLLANSVPFFPLMEYYLVSILLVVLVVLL